VQVALNSAVEMDEMAKGHPDRPRTSESGSRAEPRASTEALPALHPSEDVLAATPPEDEDAPRQRTCVGCRNHDDPQALVRFVHVPDHQPALVPDLLGKLGGRGVWMHPRFTCLQKASRGGIGRALRRELSIAPETLRTDLQSQLTRRLQGLLLAALRRRRAAVGTDAVCEALATCPVSLLLVAKDAAGRRNDVIARASQRCVRVVELLDKEALGQLTQREELSFVAILEPNIAREVADTARWLAGLSEDG
jgi:predicted RNA-binding protein YlxR (DUF448 family)